MTAGPIMRHALGLIKSARAWNHAGVRVPRSIILRGSLQPLTWRRTVVSVDPSPSTAGSNQVMSNPPEPEEDDDGQGKKQKSEGKSRNGDQAKPDPEGSSTWWKMFESSMTTLASISVLGLVGYSYTRYYKYLVLEKIENAFRPGDPVLEMAAKSKYNQFPSPDGQDSNDHWIPRPEQKRIDDIVAGRITGHYHLLIGEKGTGKSSMLIDAMHKIEGEGCAMFEAHADPEIFRVRLGRALDFEYHEDNIGSLFSIRGPRDASALLDVERAFNKMEKVALKRRKTIGRPLIIIINSVHLLRDDEDGQDLIELIQQRAEQWAASNLCTVILNSDDYWVYERLKKYATRMQVMPIADLSKQDSLVALRRYRMKYRQEDTPMDILEKVYDRVGGRLTYLNRVAKSDDMLDTCEQICRAEKTWFLNQCWILGMEMDDDVMDQQKYASAAMVLAKALVDKEKEMESTYDPEKGHVLPSIPLHEARYIMTRADFIQAYDQINLFAIGANAMVRADSVPMMNGFREICSQPGFDEHLEATLERIGDIESLGRTRELTIKDLWNGGKYKTTVSDSKGRDLRQIMFEVVAPPEDDDDDDDDDDDNDNKDSKDDDDTGVETEVIGIPRIIGQCLPSQSASTVPAASGK